MNLAVRELALTLKLKNPNNSFSQTLLHICWEHMIQAQPINKPIQSSQLNLLLQRGGPNLWSNRCVMSTVPVGSLHMLSGAMNFWGPGCCPAILNFSFSKVCFFNLLRKFVRNTIALNKFLLCLN